MAFEQILVIDDEMIVRRSLEALLQKRRYSVATAGTLEEARERLAKGSFDLVFTDLRLPDGTGDTLLEQMAEESSCPYLVMMTGYATVESAVKCMRAGAFDYLIKPFSNTEIEIIVKRAEEHRHLHNVARLLSEREVGEWQLLGNSAPVMNLRKLIRKVAPTQATVLIQGESGTGKELVASEIHRNSPRRDKPFIKVNCAAISETLIESEFFGHEKGAFTGATHRREGRFELASGGTILLDEISEVSPALQAKLLRVLQEREIERVGGTKTIQVDVRVLATTNRDLAMSVKRGDFREDLFYRLNVFPVVNPPLRDRKEDILLLTEHFIQRFQRKHGVRIKGITEAAANCLLEHDWPGNVRELQNTVERAVIMTEDDRPVEPFALGMVGVDTGTSASVLRETEKAGGNGQWLIRKPLKENEIQPMEEIEREYLLQALAAARGNRTHAANQLSISLRSLRNKLKLYRESGFELPD